MSNVVSADAFIWVSSDDQEIVENIKSKTNQNNGYPRIHQWDDMVHQSTIEDREQFIFNSFRIFVILVTESLCGDPGLKSQVSHCLDECSLRDYFFIVLFQTEQHCGRLKTQHPFVRRLLSKHCPYYWSKPDNVLKSLKARYESFQPPVQPPENLTNLQSQQQPDSVTGDNSDNSTAITNADTEQAQQPDANNDNSNESELGAESGPIINNINNLNIMLGCLVISNNTYANRTDPMGAAPTNLRTMANERIQDRQYYSMREIRRDIPELTEIEYCETSLMPAAETNQIRRDIPEISATEEHCEITSLMSAADQIDGVGLTSSTTGHMGTAEACSSLEPVQENCQDLELSVNEGRMAVDKNEPEGFLDGPMHTQTVDNYSADHPSLYAPSHNGS